MQLASEFSNPVEAVKQTILSAYFCSGRRVTCFSPGDDFLRLYGRGGGLGRGRRIGVLLSDFNKKPGSNFRSGFLNYYPAGAVQAILPFPFVKGG